MAGQDFGEMEFWLGSQMNAISSTPTTPTPLLQIKNKQTKNLTNNRKKTSKPFHSWATSFPSFETLRR